MNRRPNWPLENTSESESRQLNFVLIAGTFGGPVDRETQWGWFYRPLDHSKRTSPGMAIWSLPVMRSAHLCVRLPCPDNEPLAPYSSDLFCSLCFWYISQPQAVVIFMHKTQAFLCCDGSLKEVESSDLSLWSQRIRSTNVSTSHTMEAREISREAFSSLSRHCWKYGS